MFVVVAVVGGGGLGGACSQPSTRATRRAPPQVLGTDAFYAYLNKYGLELDPQLEALVGRCATNRRLYRVLPPPMHNTHCASPPQALAQALDQVCER